MQDDAGFTRIHRIVELDGINANNQYMFGAYNEPQVQTVQANSSLWQVRFGVRYDF